jgi:hypothetical protein
MGKVIKFRREIIVVLYYAIFLTAIVAIDRIIPGGGVHGPGFSYFLMLLFIPVTIGYFIMQLTKLEPNRNCIYIHLFVWVALFIIYFIFKVR